MALCGGGELALSRPRVGADGVHASHVEAVETLQAASVLGLRDPVVTARELLVYLMLLRDRSGLADVIRTVLAGVGACTWRRGASGADARRVLRLRCEHG